MPVWAQPPGGGGLGLDAAAMAKNAEIEAKYVAKSLSLNEEQSKKLLEAYKGYRESLLKTFTNGGDREAMRKNMTDERTKLETNLKGFMTPEQATSATGLLGAGMRWDPMVGALATLNLDEKKFNDAMKPVADYVVESVKVREANAGDADVIRSKTQELRTKLEADLGKVLSPEELAKLKEAPGFRPRRSGRNEGGSGSAPNKAPATPATPAPATPAPAPAAPKK